MAFRCTKYAMAPLALRYGKGDGKSFNKCLFTGRSCYRVLHAWYQIALSHDFVRLSLRVYPEMHAGFSP